MSLLPVDTVAARSITNAQYNTAREVIREYDMVKSIAHRLNIKGAAVTHLTTDSDAKGRDGFSHVNQANPDIPLITWYKDPSHLSRNMRKKISTGSIAGNLFGKRRDGVRWTYPEKLECKKALAVDVRKKVSLTLSNMRIYWKGDVKKMIMYVETITTYMLICYGRNHTQCRSFPLAKLTGCSGPSEGRCWFGRSHTLRAQGITHLNLTEASHKFLKTHQNQQATQKAQDRKHELILYKYSIIHRILFFLPNPEQYTVDMPHDHSNMMHHLYLFFHASNESCYYLYISAP